MNTQLKQRIDAKLEKLSEQRITEVLDFVEFLEGRERSATLPPTLSLRKGRGDEREGQLFIPEANDSGAYLVGVAQTLNEWASEADERAYHDL